jgi:hypothetical protein
MIAPTVVGHQRPDILMIVKVLQMMISMRYLLCKTPRGIKAFWMIGNVLIDIFCYAKSMRTILPQSRDQLQVGQNPGCRRLVAWAYFGRDGTHTTISTTETMGGSSL